MDHWAQRACRRTRALNVCCGCLVRVHDRVRDSDRIVVDGVVECNEHLVVEIFSCPTISALGELMFRRTAVRTS